MLVFGASFHTAIAFGVESSRTSTPRGGAVDTLGELLLAFLNRAVEPDEHVVLVPLPVNLKPAESSVMQTWAHVIDPLQSRSGCQTLFGGLPLFIYL
jgi:hypothetical protein